MRRAKLTPRARGLLAWVFIMGVVAGAWGCALPGKGGATATPAAAAESERTMTDLRAKNAGYARHVEELENRVLILQDQLAAYRTAETHPIAKPPVRIVAAREDSLTAMSGVLAHQGRPVAAAPAPDKEPPVESGGTSVLSDEDVEYGGDALVSRRAEHASERPVLRLGASSRAAVEAEIASTSEGGKSKARTAYKQALSDFRAGRNEKAAAAFRKFIEKFPRYNLVDDAQYWLAECYYERRDLRAAEAEYRTVIEKYPGSSKLPQAMLKLGLTLLAEGEKDSGRRVLESLSRGYPRHEAGRSAATRLARLDGTPASGAAATVATSAEGRAR